MASRQLKLERLFEQGIKNIGPTLSRLDLETQCSPGIKSILKDTVAARVNACLRSAMKHFVPHKEPNWIYFDYVNDTRLNAVAFQEQNHYFIGLTGGAPLLLLRFFGHLLSFRETFTFVGDPGAERADPKTIPYIVTDCEQYGYLLDMSPGAAPSAVDPERQKYAFVLLELALTFLAQHEFAHIYQGHLLLLGEQAGRPFIPELSWQASDGLTTTLVQALEWDADRFAANQGYTSASAWSEGRVTPPDHYRSFFQGPEDGMFTWFLAIYLLFRLMTAGEGTVLETFHSHPPPQVRIRMIADYMCRFIARTMPGFLKEWEPLLNRVIGEAENAIARQTASSFDTAQVQKAGSPEVLAHMRKIQAEYDSLTPEFDRLKQTFSR